MGSRPRVVAIVVAVLTVAGAVQAGVVLTRRPPPEPRAAGPAPTISASTTPTDPPSARPSRKRKARPAPSRTATKRPPARAAIFTRFATWVDNYDFGEIDPVASVAEMKRHGVRVLYLQTGRFNRPADGVDVSPEVGPWLVAAHQAGIDVVGWYLPSYEDVPREVRRMVAAARYRYQGHAFDAIGIDIEYKDVVADPEIWNARVVEHARAVRRELGRRYPIAAITPPPVQMDVAPARWRGFPWRDLAAVSDAFVLMAYWSFRTDCPEVKRHCAYGYTVSSVRVTRELIAPRRLPVHIIGGIGEASTAQEVVDFVRASRAVRANGISLYDFGTTTPDMWAALRGTRP